MASTATIGNLETTIRHIGRAAVFYQVGAYAGSSADLTLVYLGDTEGEITVEDNAEFSELTTPELTGPVAREKYLEGIKPVVTIPLFGADPALSLIVNPTGVASGSQGGGFERRQAVTEYSLVLFPEEVFIESNAPVAIEYTTAADWKVGADTATAAQLALLDKSIFFWRGHFESLLPRYSHEDGGKLITEVVFHAMHNNAMQQGHYIYTIGAPEPRSRSAEGVRLSLSDVHLDWDRRLVGPALRVDVVPLLHGVVVHRVEDNLHDRLPAVGVAVLREDLLEVSAPEPYRLIEERELRGRRGVAADTPIGRDRVGERRRRVALNEDLLRDDREEVLGDGLMPLEAAALATRRRPRRRDDDVERRIAGEERDRDDRLDPLEVLRASDRAGELRSRELGELGVLLDGDLALGVAEVGERDVRRAAGIGAGLVEDGRAPDVADRGFKVPD